MWKIKFQVIFTASWRQRSIFHDFAFCSSFLNRGNYSSGFWKCHIRFPGEASSHKMHLEKCWKPRKVRWESQWVTEWMCWCLEVNIQYPTLRVLHVWISLSEQGQGRYRTGREGAEPKTGDRKIERDIKGCERSWFIFPRRRAEPECSVPVAFCRHGKNTPTSCSQAEFMLPTKSLTFIISWHRSSVMAGWFWQWSDCWKICTPFLSVLHGCDFHNPFFLFVFLLIL